MQELLLRVERKEIGCAILKNGRLHDLFLERTSTKRIVGNIYRGVVTNILDNIQSAFVDVGEMGNGFIHISDIIENKKKWEKMFDMDVDVQQKKKEGKSHSVEKIEQLLQRNQVVLVQVVKEAMGSKGARLTCDISLPGRYFVLLPNTPQRGISRKIEDPTERNRLRRFLRSLDLPEGVGIICRTISQEASFDLMEAEVRELLLLWKQTIETFYEEKQPACLYKESDVIKRFLMQAIDQNFSRILINDHSVVQRCRELHAKYGKEKKIKIEYYRDKMPIFDRFHITREIEKSLCRKVWLSCGGYLYFDQTEAMYTIDVNSGRSPSRAQNERNLEEAIVRINLEAADEIARQLRLRNIGGIIICDFIDMRSSKSHRRVLLRLKEAMKDDMAKCTVLGMSEFGLIEMTRQRNRESLAEMIFSECPYCERQGWIKTDESVFLEIERKVKKAIFCHDHFALQISVHPQLKKYIEKHEKEEFQTLLDEWNAAVTFVDDDRLHLNDYVFHSLTNRKKINV